MFKRLKFPSSLTESIWILYLIFFLIFFYTTYFLYEPELLYYKLQPFFAFDSAFYQFHFDFRQGYLSLASQFILQFLYYPILGSLLLSILLLFLAFLLRRVFKKTIDQGYSGLEFLLPLILLLPLKYYTVGIEVIISIYIAVVVYLISNLLHKSFLLHSLYQVASVLGVLLVFGLAPAILLGLLYFPKSSEFLKKQRIIVTYFVLLFVLAAASYFLFGSKILKAQLNQFSLVSHSAVYPMFWLICIVIFIIIAIGYFPKFKVFSPNNSMSVIYKRLFTFSTLIIIISIVGVSTLYRNSDKYKTIIDLHVLNKDWDNALLYSDKISIQDRIARFQLNRALNAKGRMSEDLFTISQAWGEYGLLLSKEISMESMPYLSDFFYDLGYIKASKYCMLEFQTASPYAPISLERLAATSLILGEFPICSKYYTILSHSVIYGKQYSKLLKKIQKQPYLLMTENTPKNTTILSGDKIINLKEPDLDLYNILEVSPHNKMAFEYLMSYYILRNDLETFYKLLPMALNSGYYKKIPKTWEEALILYYSENSIPFNSGNLKISPQSIERFKEFRKIIIENGSDVNKLKELLKPAFKSSFWYYRYFDNPDLGNKIKKSK